MRKKFCLLFIIGLFLLFSYSYTYAGEKLTLYVNESVELDAKVFIEEKISENETIDWSTSKPDIVSVNNSGEITAQKSGKAEVKASVNTGTHIKEAVIDVEVLNTIKDVKILSDDQVYIKIGEERIIDYKVIPKENLSVNPNLSVEWIWTNEELLQVDSKGVIKGINEGQVNLYLRSVEGAISDNIKVYISSSVDDIEFEEDVEEIYVGETKEFDLNFIPEDAFLKDYTLEDLLETEYIKIDGQEVTGVSEGETYIRATSVDGNEQDNLQIKVLSTVKGVTLDEKDKLILKGSSPRLLKYSLEKKYDDVDIVNDKVIFETTDSSVVSVSSDGEVVAKDKGLVKITITTEDGEHKDGIIIESTYEPPKEKKKEEKEEIAVEKFSIEELPEKMVVGKKYPLEYKVLPENATDRSIDFDVSPGSDKQIFLENNQYYFVPKYDDAYSIEASVEEGKITKDIFTDVVSAVNSVTIDTGELEEEYGRYIVYLGQEFTLDYALKKNKGVDHIYLEDVEWDIDNIFEAEDHEKGQFKAIAKGIGKIEITTEDGEKTDDVVIEVKSAAEDIIVGDIAKIGLFQPFSPILKFIPKENLYYEIDDVFNKSYDLDVEELYISEKYLQIEKAYEEKKLNEDLSDDLETKHKTRNLYLEFALEEKKDGYVRVDNLGFELTDREFNSLKVGEVKDNKFYGYIVGKAKLKITTKDGNIEKFLDIKFDDSIKSLVIFDKFGNVISQSEVVTEKEVKSSEEYEEKKNELEEDNSETGLVEQLKKLYKNKNRDLPSDWAIEAVEEARDNELLLSSVDASYQKPITRLEFIHLIMNLYEMVEETNLKEVPYIYFTDTDDQVVHQAFQMGIVSGVGNRKYNPEGLVTREEMCKIIDKVLEKIEVELAIDSSSVEFVDRNQISSWAVASVDKYTKTYGLFGGVGNSRFNPKGNATREQVLIIINRLFKNLNK